MKTETKVISTIIGVTVLVTVGVFFLIFWLQKSEGEVPEVEIVSKNGLHWHPKLNIYLQGQKQEIPPDIGIGAVHETIHTHTEDAGDGIIHMEMQGVVTKNDTRLGNFFRIWGKEFNSNQIFDSQNGPEGTVTMMINGQRNNEFENYLMKDGDIIEIKYE